MVKARRAAEWMLLWVALALTGCGGGSGGGGAPSAEGTGTVPAAAPSQTPVTVTTTQATFSPSLPLAAAARVVAVASPLQTAGVGQSLRLPATDSSGDTLILAVDAERNIIAAGPATGSSTVLEADSTALALARIALGTPPGSFTAPQINQAIRGAPAFAALTVAVAQAWRDGAVPRDHGAVDAALGAVSEQTARTLERTPQGGTATASRATRVLPLSAVRAEPPTPYVIYGTANVGVHITAGGIKLANTQPIVWSAYTSVDPSSIRQLPSASGKQIVMVTAAGGIGDTAVVGAGLREVALPNNSGNPFDLTITQDRKAREENLKELLFETSSLLMNLMTSSTVLRDKCAAKIMDALYKPEDIDPLAQAPSMETFRNYVLTLARKDVLNAIEDCVGGAGTPSAEYIGAIVKTSIGANQTRQAFDAASLAGKYYSNYANWGLTYTIGVCETPGAFGYALVSCATRFEIDPVPTMVPGSETTLQVKGFDRSGRPTPAPVTLRLASTGSGSILMINEQTRAVTAVGEGITAVTVTDPVTEVTAIAPITVIEPKLAPATATARAGETVTLTMVDDAGRAVVPPKDRLIWTSSASATVEVPPLGTLLTGGVLALARNPGTATITGRHPLWKTTPSSVVTVTAAPNPPPPQGIAVPELNVQFAFSERVTDDVSISGIPVRCQTGRWQDFNVETRPEYEYEECTHLWASYATVTCSGPGCAALEQRYSLHAVTVPGQCTATIPGLSVGSDNAVSITPSTGETGLGRSNMSIQAGSQTQLTGGYYRRTYTGRPPPNAAEQYAYYSVSCDYDVYLRGFPDGERFITRRNASGGY